MPTKTLRVVRDSKYTGAFTRSQIERAIRTVERDSARGDFVRKGRSGSSSKSAAKRSASGKR
jgi:hypothetical protein